MLVEKGVLMKMLKSIVAALAIIPSLAMSAPVQTSCIKDLTATNKRVVRCDGIKYNLSVPSDCVAGGCGLIFDVHGYSMNGNSQNANTGLAELGREHNYVVVQPSANGGSWGRSDYRKVHDFLLQNKTAWNIDANRIHFTGFSQGSIMTWEFVCKYPELIASAAPIAYQFRSSCESFLSIIVCNT